MDFAVIMAGGTGKRLWPLSRQKRPKQVLKLLDGETLLRRCLERLTPIFDKRNIIVLTNAGYADIVRENLPEIPYGNVVAEPAVRDTAGAIGLAATVLSKFDANATMVVVTADQVIEPDDVFQSVVRDSLTYINSNPDALITYGIDPTFPATQLGYIKLGSAEQFEGCDNKICKVESFKEKPDKQTAQEYLDSGSYCWNSGMFVWKAKTILDKITSYLPEAVEPLSKIKAAWDGPKQKEVLKQWFLKMPKISIDFAVMEKADNVFAIRLDCRWLDMGSFAALADIIKSDDKNNIVVAGHSELLDSKNNIVVTEDKKHLIATIGLENIVVAHSPDATLVCHVDQTHRLKELLDLIGDHGGKKFL
ncbi:MAG: mannose-1-phosphate guanylyltransferase [Sedimentisphaerales bacterium]|nr:mannose-1-phosphate guanylyltransferase [Sedimentisphaerales bacterium]